MPVILFFLLHWYAHILMNHFTFNTELISSPASTTRERSADTGEGHSNHSTSTFFSSRHPSPFFHRIVLLQCLPYDLLGAPKLLTHEDFLTIPCFGLLRESVARVCAQWCVLSHVFVILFPHRSDPEIYKNVGVSLPADRAMRFNRMLLRFLLYWWVHRHDLALC